MGRGGEQALDVVSRMLAYDPLKRIKPLEVCSHDFVDEVRGVFDFWVVMYSCPVPVPWMSVALFPVGGGRVCPRSAAHSPFEQ